MSKGHVYDAVALWEGEAMLVLDDAGRPSGLDVGSLRGKRVVVVLSRRTSQVRATELPPASPEDLRQLVRLRVGDLFPAGLGDLAFSVAPRSEGAMGPTPIFAARTSDLTEIHGVARSVGFRVVAILPIAAGSALLARELGLTDALIAAPEAEGLGFDVVRDGETTLSRPVPPGSPLEGEVRRTFLASNSGTLPIVAASGAPIPFADRSTERNPIATLLEAPDRWDNLDLVPEDVRAKRLADVRRMKLRQGGMIAAASLLLMAFVINMRATASAEVERERRKYNLEVRRFEGVLGGYTAKNTKLEPQVKLLERAFTPAQRTSDVTYLVSSLVPDRAWLTAIVFDKGKPLQIRGTSLTSEAVASYVKNLGTQKRLRDVKLSFANVGEIESKPVVNFAITAFPVGNVPIEEPKKTGARAAAPAAGATSATNTAR